jgi:hypothetical protein
MQSLRPSDVAAFGPGLAGSLSGTPATLVPTAFAADAPPSAAVPEPSDALLLASGLLLLVLAQRVCSRRPARRHAAHAREA